MSDARTALRQTQLKQKAQLQSKQVTASTPSCLRLRWGLLTEFGRRVGNQNQEDGQNIFQYKYTSKTVTSSNAHISVDCDRDVS